MKRMSDLKPGCRAIIRQINEDASSRLLMEMGCVPGVEITLEKTAPLGDPIAIKLHHTRIGIAKYLASHILVEEIDITTPSNIVNGHQTL